MKSRRPRTARLHDLYTSPEPGASLLNAPVWCSRSPGGGGPPRKSGFHKNFLRKVQCVLPDDKKHTHIAPASRCFDFSHRNTDSMSSCQGRSPKKNRTLLEPGAARSKHGGTHPKPNHIKIHQEMGRTLSRFFRATSAGGSGKLQEAFVVVVSPCEVVYL